MSSYLDLGDVNGIVLSCPQPFRPSDVCLACLHADGRLELLTGAWEGVLGYSQPELDRRRLHSLLAYGYDAARAALRRLLDPDEPEPILIDVIVKNGSVRILSVHRRFDPYEPSLYLACEPFNGAGMDMSFARRTLSFRSRP